MPPRFALDASSFRRLVSARDAWIGGDLDEAVAAAVAVDAPSASALALTMASRVLVALGDVDGAQRCGERAVSRAEDAIREHPVAVRWQWVLAAGLGLTHRAGSLLRSLAGTPAPDALLLAEGATYLAWADDDSAGAVARRALERGARGASVVRIAAAGLARGGDDAGAEALLVEALADADDEAARALCEALLDRGSWSSAERVLTSWPTSPELAELRAELALWKGDDGAFEAARGHAPARARARLDGARALARGRLDDAAAHLASADDGDAVALVLAGELRLRRGDFAGATELLVRAGNLTEDSSAWVAQQALLVAASARAGRTGAGRSLAGQEPLERALHALAGVSGALGEVLPTEALLAGVEALLAKLGPNRTRWTAYRDEAGALRAFAAGVSVRALCQRAQRALLSTTAASTLARFDALAEAHRETAFVAMYRGEVLLWEGRYDEAAACFERPIANDMRWAPIGMAAAAMGRGAIDDAGRWLDAAERHQAGPGPTWFAWKGEWALARGDVEAARRWLSVAVERSPRRLGAAVALTLACVEAGANEEASRRWTQLGTEAPALLWAASRHVVGMRSPAACPASERVSVLRRALVLSRGNRASTLPRYLDDQGRAFAVPPPAFRRPLSLDAATLGALLARMRP